jgi:hypothetical protein
MPNTPKMDERVGWELIWRHGNEHPRYGSYAAPDGAVMDWATALPAGVCVCYALNCAAKPDIAGAPPNSDIAR